MRLSLERLVLGISAIAVTVACGGDDFSTQTGAGGTSGSSGAGAGGGTTGGSSAGGASGSAGLGGSSAGVGGSGAVAGGAAGTGATAGAGGASGSAGSAGCALDDDFDDPSTDVCWDVVNGAAVTYDHGVSSPGQLTVEQEPNNPWFNSDEGFGYFKLGGLNGNFVIQTHVTASSLENPAAPLNGAAQFTGAGLMIRNPDAANGPQNYMLSIGRGLNEIGVRYQATIAGASQGMQQNVNYNSVLLRMCRIGQSISLYYREVNDETWQEATTYMSTPPLPDSVAVGLVTYQFAMNDRFMRASFDHFRGRTGLTLRSQCTDSLDP